MQKIHAASPHDKPKHRTETQKGFLVFYWKNDSGYMQLVFATMGMSTTVTEILCLLIFYEGLNNNPLPSECFCLLAVDSCFNFSLLYCLLVRASGNTKIVIKCNLSL